MSDSYYELIDESDSRGEKFAATDLVRSTWSAAIQHGAPVSALLVRALERCEPRDDTRLSRVMVDLLGASPPRAICGCALESSAPASKSSWSAPRCSHPGLMASRGPSRRPADGG